MRRTSGFRPLAVAGLLVAALTGGRAHSAVQEASSTPATAGQPGAELPVARQLHYRMAGRVRPLLFWIGRDRVGLARATWRGALDHRGFELLIGTDPRVAPRGINRWGFISEERTGAGGSVLAFMSRSDEETVSDVEARAAHQDDFKVMRSVTGSGRTRWQLAALRTGSQPTIHDLDGLLADVDRHLVKAPGMRERSVTDERGGFLTALVDLLETGRRDPVPYVFGQQRHILRIRSSSNSQRPWPSADAAEMAPWREAALQRTTFEITTPASGGRTTFEMIHATRGAMAGAPTWVAWQPRWWLKVEVFLESGGPDAHPAAIPPGHPTTRRAGARASGSR